MLRAFAFWLTLGWFVVAWTPAASQDSPRRLERGRKMTLSADEAWRRAVRVAADAPGIVNTVDPESRLLSFTMPLSAADVKSMALEGKEIEKQPQMLHVTIWIPRPSAETTVFVRAAPGSVGFFSHSNGLIESQILDAIQNGAPWRSLGAGERVKELAQPLERAWEAANALLKSSTRIVVNEANRQIGVLTCSMAIPSSAFKTYAPATQGYYPGRVHITFWLDRAGQVTRIRMRALMLESGSVSPTALASSGLLENTLFDAIEKRLGGEDVALTIASDYKEKPGFWAALFGGEPSVFEEIEKTGLKQELPAPAERVWTAAIKVLSQSSVINKCDWQAKTLSFVAAHPSDSQAKYSAHPMSVRLAPSEFGTMLYVSSGEAVDTPKELSSERKVIAERIATELFLKDKLKWLLETKGGNR